MFFDTGRREKPSEREGIKNRCARGCVRAFVRQWANRNPLMPKRKTANLDLTVQIRISISFLLYVAAIVTIFLSVGIGSRAAPV
jgi:hypothetical protein